MIGKFVLFLGLALCSASFADGLYQRFLVRMKKVQAPRSPGKNGITRSIKEQGKASLAPLLKAFRSLEPKALSGPRAPRSVPIRSVNELWLINSASVVCRSDYTEKLKLIAGVEEIYPDEKVVLSTADSGGAGILSDENRKGVSTLHAEGLRGQGVKIGIIDTGIIEHVAFGKRISAYRDFTAKPAAGPVDPVGHGTHVAGTLAGGSYKERILGVAPESELVVARVLEPVSKSGSTTEVQQRIEAFASRILNAMQWMVDPDGDPSTDDYPAIINNSWGFPQKFPITRQLFEEALNRWAELGILPIFAAGNDGKKGEGSILFPGSTSQVITVGALKDSKRAYFSGMGTAKSKKPDFMAPGYRVYSLKKFGNKTLLGPMSGTSMATPYVAGLTALLRQMDPYMSFQEVYEVLKESAVDLGARGWDTGHGWGKPDSETIYSHMKKKTRSKFSKGGKSGFRYYRRFYLEWQKTRDPSIQRSLINVELGLLAFAEKHSQPSSKERNPILVLWLNELEKLANSEPELFAPLRGRILKRIRFISIPGTEPEIPGDDSEEKEISSPQ
ncbi:S8 family serine peptidase [bacterium]|nr:S8 family serine peptidase [bacterium]